MCAIYRHCVFVGFFEGLSRHKVMHPNIAWDFCPKGYLGRVCYSVPLNHGIQSHSFFWLFKITDQKFPTGLVPFFFFFLPISSYDYRNMQFSMQGTRLRWKHSVHAIRQWGRYIATCVTSSSVFTARKKKMNMTLLTKTKGNKCVFLAEVLHTAMWDKAVLFFAQHTTFPCIVPLFQLIMTFW